MRKCYSPTKTGRFCWMQMMSPKQCKPGTFRTFHPKGRDDVAFTGCRKKTTGKYAIQRKGKLKKKSGACPAPVCKRYVRRKKRR